MKQAMAPGLFTQLELQLDPLAIGRAAAGPGASARAPISASRPKAAAAMRQMPDLRIFPLPLCHPAHSAILSVHGGREWATLGSATYFCVAAVRSSRVFSGSA